MLGRYKLENNVRVALSASISAVASSITFTNAAGMFNDPPSPAGDDASGGLSIATLQDAALPPTKTEIITYTGVTDNGDGTKTLTGVQRSIEGTTAQTFASGAILFQAATAGQFDDDVVTVDRSGATDSVTVSGALAVTDTVETMSACLNTGVLSPATPAAALSNWNPAGLASARIIRVDTTGWSPALAFTGLAGGVNGRVITVVNLGPELLQMKSDAAESTASNRFIFPGNEILLPSDACANLWYDGASSRWRIIGVGPN